LSDSVDTTSPNGGVDDRRGLTKPALSEDRLEQVLEPANLRAAWKRVRANRGAPGVDGMSIEEFPAFAREHWPDICDALESGTYDPSPVRQKVIPKPNGGERLLGYDFSPGHAIRTDHIGSYAAGASLPLPLPLPLPK